MTKKSLVIPLLIFIGFCFSCELGPPGLAGLVGNPGVDGASGTAGTDGANSRIVPGGIVSLQLLVGTVALPATEVSITIMFDDDEICSEGDELFITVDFTPYLTGTNEAAHSLTWSAPSIPPGEYFIYAWIETGTSNGVFDEASPDEMTYNNDAVSVFSPGAYYEDLSGAPAVIVGTGNLAPNYIVTENIASQVDFSFYYQTPFI